MMQWGANPNGPTFEGDELLDWKIVFDPEERVTTAECSRTSRGGTESENTYNQYYQVSHNLRAEDYPEKIVLTFFCEHVFAPMDKRKTQMFCVNCSKIKLTKDKYKLTKEIKGSWKEKEVKLGKLLQKKYFRKKSFKNKKRRT